MELLLVPFMNIAIVSSWELVTYCNIVSMDRHSIDSHIFNITFKQNQYDFLWMNYWYHHLMLSHFISVYPVSTTKLWLIWSNSRRYFSKMLCSVTELGISWCWDKYFNHIPAYYLSPCLYPRISPMVQLHNLSQSKDIYDDDWNPNWQYLH